LIAALRFTSFYIGTMRFDARARARVDVKTSWFDLINLGIHHHHTSSSRAAYAVADAFTDDRVIFAHFYTDTFTTAIVATVLVNRVC